MCGGFDTLGVEQAVHEATKAGTVAVIGEWVVAAGELQRLRTEVPDIVTRYHRSHPNERGIELAALSTRLKLEPQYLRAFIETRNDEHRNGLVIDQGFVRAHDHVGRASETPEGIAFLGALRGALFGPPSASEVGTDIKVARALVREGAVLDFDGVLFAPEAFERAAALVSAALHEQGSLTVSEIRDLLGSSRKYVLPLVNALDAGGVTRRRGDDRIPGPRAVLASETSTESQ